MRQERCFPMAKGNGRKHIAGCPVVDIGQERVKEPDDTFKITLPGNQAPVQIVLVVIGMR